MQYHAGRVRKNVTVYGPRPARDASAWTRDAIRDAICTCDDCCRRDPRRLTVRAEKDRRAAAKAK